MFSKEEALAEAYKRGLLPEDRKAAYEEAIRRGLVGKTATAPQAQEGFGFTDIPRNKAEQDAAKEMDKSILARTGRAALSFVASPSDAIYAAGAVPYNLTRGVQAAIGADVAPPLTMQSPGDAARAAYDKFTNNAGQSEGLAKIADTAAEYMAGGASLGKMIPSMASRTATDLAADAATGAATQYTKQEVTENPVVQMMAGIVSALATRGASGAISKTAEKATPQIKAEDKVLQRLADSDVNPATLDKARPLVDVGGKNVERLGEAVANIPGKGADIAEKFVAERTAEAGKNIKKTISDYVSSGGDLNQTMEAIIKAGREKAAPKYEAAYSVPIAPDKKLEAFMARPAMKKAIANAESIAKNEGESLESFSRPEKYFDFVSGGMKRDSHPLTKYYDYVKRGLDDVLEGYRDKTTGRLVLDTEGRAIEGLRKNYVQRLKELNPAYKDALQESSTYFESKNAVQNGKDFLDKTPIQLGDTMKSLNKIDKELFKLGVANKLREMVDSSNIGTDLSKKIFGKQEYKDNLRAILEPKEYGQLKKSLEQQAEEHKLNQRLLGNSRTILRKEEIDNLMQDPSELLSMATSPAKFGLGKVTQYISNRYQGLNKEVAGEIAKILFERNPSKQKDIILRLQRRAATGYKPALRGYTLLNNISKSGALQTINQGE